MAKRPPTKREFDWRSYSKPDRALSDEQQSALSGGVLRPLVGWTLATPGARMEIRARQSAIYYRGVFLLRIRIVGAPFEGEIDANVRLPRSDRSGAERLETWPLSSASEVAAALRELDALRASTDRFAEDAGPSDRALLHAFASANGSPESGFVVVDTEYQYGHRRFDFVAMQRAAGVGGPAGFTTPRLVIGQLIGGGRRLDGNGGIAAHAADFAEFARALSGTHLERSRTEMNWLVAQKQRLGLLPEEIPFRHFTDDNPIYLVVFSGIDLGDPGCTAPIAEVHDRLLARHYPADLLRLADVGGDVESVPLAESAAMTYKEFKAYRARLSA